MYLLGESECPTNFNNYPREIHHQLGIPVLQNSEIPLYMAHGIGATQYMALRLPSTWLWGYTVHGFEATQYMALRLHSTWLWGYMSLRVHSTCHWGCWQCIAWGLWDLVSRVYWVYCISLHQGHQYEAVNRPNFLTEYWVVDGIYIKIMLVADLFNLN